MTLFISTLSPTLNYTVYVSNASSGQSETFLFHGMVLQRMLICRGQSLQTWVLNTFNYRQGRVRGERHLGRHSHGHEVQDQRLYHPESKCLFKFYTLGASLPSLQCYVWFWSQPNELEAQIQHLLMYNLMKVIESLCVCFLVSKMNHTVNHKAVSEIKTP